MGQQQLTGSPGPHVIGAVGVERVDQPRRAGRPDPLTVRAEPVADHRLDQPMHPKDLVGGVHQRIPPQRDHRLVQLDRVGGDPTQRRGQLLGAGVEQVAGICMGPGRRTARAARPRPGGVVTTSPPRRRRSPANQATGAAVSTSDPPSGAVEARGSAEINLITGRATSL